MKIRKQSAQHIYLFTLILLTLIHFIILPVYSQGPSEQEGLTITDIKITGNRAVSNNTILTKIKLRKGDKFLQKAVNEDIKRLYAMGFFADVTAEVEEYEEGVRLIFSVTEKSVIEKVIYKGNKIYKEEVLSKEVETKEGDVLNKRRLSEDVRKIRNLYKRKGFPLVEVSYDTQIDPETNKTTIYITVDEKMRYRIREIHFEGNYAFTDKRLLKVISTRPKKFFTSGFLDEETLEQDTERLKWFYKSNGFIDAKASRSVDYKEEANRIDLTIRIEEGDKYYVGDVNITGNAVITDKELRKDLRMEKGQAYDPANLRMDVMSVQSLYFDKGYISCQVHTDTLLDKDRKSIDIAYMINEGGLGYVNEVRITGNSKTKDVVIRRELRLYPGEQYDGKKMKKSKQRLYDLGFFDEVLFETLPTEEENMRDLLVSVKETKTGEFSFGGGYSSVDKFIGFVEVMQRNFDIANFPTFTGAGQNLRIRAELGSVRRNYILSFTEPWIFGHPYLFGFDLFNYERERETSLGLGYDELRRGGDVRLGKEFTDYDRADLMYKIERVEISNVSTEATSALKDEEGKNTISSLALTLTHNTTDSRFNPTEGLILSATGENAGGVIGGDKDFYKFSTLSSYYINYEKRLVVEFKVRTGWADNYDDTTSVPIYERYFAGGANTVRGYKERSIGPRDSKTLDAIGGESMLIGNVEATYPIFKNFKIAAFYDIGNVWEEADDIGNGNFKSAVGTGIRVKTPIGPIKVDVGYPLDKAHAGDKKKARFHFSMTRGF